jgi:hypothetical protein
MSQIQLFQNKELLSPAMGRLVSFLGSPAYKVDSARQQIRAWGQMGASELKITHDLFEDNWTLEFMIFTSKTSYRKRLNNASFYLAQGWLEANAEFIMENMSRE